MSLLSELGTATDADPGSVRMSQEVRRSGSPMDRSTDRTVMWSWIVLAVPLVIVLIGAWNYRWVQEDAFINFRVIANLLAGHGPVFNVGERVEAYSDPLWMFSLAGFHAVLPFISIEWLSVAMGLVGTATGMILGGRAIQKLGSKRHSGVVVPIGLLIFSVVAGVWEFATSGLEMGMVFGWIGLSFWLLVRTEENRKSVVCCAFVLGLGTLIRPELVLISGVFLVSLAYLVAAPGWKGAPTFGRRWIAPLVAAMALPLAYEVWRMAYFAMVISNSSLAKSATGSDVPQGAYYVWDFISTYALWVPFLLALPLMVPRLRHWWSTGDRTGSVVLLAPPVAGLVDGLYVFHLGGDYMEARLLLPAFLCSCIVVYADSEQFRTLLAIPLVAIIVWCAVCGCSLRYEHGSTWSHGVLDERSNWITDTGNRHPIDPSGFSRLLSFGDELRKASTSVPRNGQQMLVLQDPDAVYIIASHKAVSASVLAHEELTYVETNALPATSPLPFHLAINLNNIGALAYVTGSSVYVYDGLSLANPIGSHTSVAVRTTPGHEKQIGPEWMIARFGLQGERYPYLRWLGSPELFTAARRALGCAPLSNYMHAITAPLTASLVLSNITHAFTYTRMSFSPDPENAEQQLCP